MNQKLLSGLTATLLVTTFGVTTLGDAKPSEAGDQGSEASLKAPSQSSTPPLAKPDEVVKIGERQPQSASAVGTVIAKVHAHQLDGRDAATLYVRNIPVLTFVSAATVSSAKGTASAAKGTATNAAQDGIKLGTQQPQAAEQETLATTNKALTTVNDVAPAIAKKAVGETNANADSPVARATVIAARLNQLSRDGMDAKDLTVSWNAPSSQSGSTGESYSIKANGIVLAVLNADTVLPDSTRRLEVDALQATNRLRRLLGNAAPLAAVTGKPKRNPQEISLGSIRLSASGYASWYGPGFDGNMSASGEVFNQNSLTAAHRTLPFGTRVRVTNMDNGQSVIVRINDRGPFHGDRIIDLSAAAARVVGVMQSGVAPVRLDILSPQAAAGN